MIRKYLAWARGLTHSLFAPITASEPMAIEACWLEDRLLYSATALPVDMIDAAFDQQPLVSQDEIDSLLALVDAELNSDNSTFAANVTSDLPEPTSPETGPPAQQVAFVDAGLDNLQQLLDQIQSSSDAATGNWEVVLLDRHTSGLDQINAFLAESDQLYSSIHLVTHGASGLLQLGSDWISSDSLSEHSQQLMLWRDSLTEDADLLIYGCSVASTEGNADSSGLSNTEAGQAWLLQLSEILDVDIAASEDLTGHAAQGGNWALEFSIGEIDSQLVLTQEVMANWHGMLDLTAAGSETLINGSTGSLQQNTPETGQHVAMDASG
ncbi:MAG: DUF4347 domain-containing protein, partial [Pirellulaceae bacterium]|nr:DUF4347 domain-containing protein [Pirellulaceae bacterium]